MRPGDELDWDRLARYLQSHFDDLGSLVAVRQFPNGAANLTYLLEFAGRRLVIRRPPFGEIAVGAHDMKREYRALSRLWRHYDRAPRAYLLCEDHAVAGADFLVIEYRAGQVVWGRIPPSMAGHQDVARRIGFAVVDAMAELHLLDPGQAGVGDLGRPDGFVDRQLRGWQQRWHAVAPGLMASTSPAPGNDVVAEVGAELAATKPATARSSVLHNDFKIDNCQFDPANPDRVLSVFDWDMATIGDPLVDLGTLLNYWPDPSDDPGDRPSHPAGQEEHGPADPRRSRRALRRDHRRRRRRPPAGTRPSARGRPRSSSPSSTTATCRATATTCARDSRATASCRWPGGRRPSWPAGS